MAVATAASLALTFSRLVATGAFSTFVTLATVFAATVSAMASNQGQQCHASNQSKQVFHVYLLFVSMNSTII